MAQPIAVKNGQAFAFPNICLTIAPNGAEVPIPYPSIADLGAAKDVSDNVTVGGTEVLIKTSKVQNTSGDEPAKTGKKGGECAFTSASETVLVNGEGVVRMGDQTEQNDGNAVGTVLSGVSTVLVGG